MLAYASRPTNPVCLLMIDLDHFRDINERFGHPVGDQALANVGAALRSALRYSDFAGRNGGEIFVVILPDTDLAGTARSAENLPGSCRRHHASRCRPDCHRQYRHRHPS